MHACVLATLSPHESFWTEIGSGEGHFNVSFIVEKQSDKEFV